ncbi:membrane protein insertase YidC [Fonticella tunisiensis]|nr:membrane protein insertase YidC [Fonticella tunisiensis]
MEIINSGVFKVVTNKPLGYLLDIAIFTAVIRFLILPLTISQTRSTIKMGKIQPKLKKLQEKYKNDPQKLQQAQMELYKEEGVNPFAGCLPLLIQFPIFIAMYQVILNFQPLKEVPFFLMRGSFGALFRGDINQILILLLALSSGATTYISGLIMSPKGDDQAAQTQKKMNIYMSLLFMYMSYTFNVGIVLYWIIGNLIQMGQQYFIINKIKHNEEEKLAE